MAVPLLQRVEAWGDKDPILGAGAGQQERGQYQEVWAAGWGGGPNSWAPSSLSGPSLFSEFYCVPFGDGLLTCANYKLSFGAFREFK